MKRFCQALIYFDFFNYAIAFYLKIFALFFSLRFLYLLPQLYIHNAFCNWAYSSNNDLKKEFCVLALHFINLVVVIRYAPSRKLHQNNFYFWKLNQFVCIIWSNWNACLCWVVLFHILKNGEAAEKIESLPNRTPIFLSLLAVNLIIGILLQQDFILVR